MTTVVRTIHFAVKSRRKRLVVGPETPEAALPGRVPRVARLMALAIKYDGLLRKGVVADLSELARLCQVTQPRMTQIMNLLHLAPDIQEALLHLPASVAGRDSLTERHLRALAAMVQWDTQRTHWKVLAKRLSIPHRADAMIDSTRAAKSAKDSA